MQSRRGAITSFKPDVDLSSSESSLSIATYFGRQLTCIHAARCLSRSIIVIVVVLCRWVEGGRGLGETAREMAHFLAKASPGGLPISEPRLKQCVNVGRAADAGARSRTLDITYQAQMHTCMTNVKFTRSHALFCGLYHHLFRGLLRSPDLWPCLRHDLYRRNHHLVSAHLRVGPVACAGFFPLH